MSSQHQGWFPTASSVKEEKRQQQAHPARTFTTMTPKLRTQLLKDHVDRMRLDPDARFLSQQDAAIAMAEDHKQMILAWRRAQQKVQLQKVPTNSDTD